MKQPVINVLPVNVEGEILAKLRNMFGPKAQIQESDIRLEHVLTSTNVSRKFDMNGNQQNNRALEKFIGNNDLVIAYALKVAVDKVDNTGTTTLATNGNGPDFTYPDLFVFDVAALLTAVSEADALESIWAGNITMKSNTFEVLEQMILRRFRIVPETQASADTQAQLNDKGFVPFLQPYIFSGRDGNKMDFEPAAGADTTAIGGATDTQNILVFHFKCFTVRNGAQPLTVEEARLYAAALKKYTSNGALL